VVKPATTRGPIPGHENGIRCGWYGRLRSSEPRKKLGRGSLPEMAGSLTPAVVQRTFLSCAFNADSVFDEVRCYPRWFIRMADAVRTRVSAIRTHSSFLSRFRDIVRAGSGAPGVGLFKSIGGEPDFFSSLFNSGMSLDSS
jgi:hypothetical protein